MEKTMTELASNEKILTFTDPEVQRCPFSAYNTIRSETPVFKDPVSGSYILTRFADIRKVATNTRQFSNNTDLTTSPASRPELDALWVERGIKPEPALALLDPPAHRHHRVL